MREMTACNALLRGLAIDIHLLHLLPKYLFRIHPSSVSRLANENYV